MSSHIGPIFGPDDSTVLSSAYVTSLMLSGGEGSFDMYRLDRFGDKIAPCGTPCFIFLSLDFAPWNST